MPIDSLIDSLVNFRARLGIASKKGSPQRDNQTSLTSGGTRRHGRELENGPNNHQSPPRGFFPEAHNFNVINPIMVEGTVNMLSNGNSVMHHLVPHMDPHAAVDSSARWPPPSCHPGTRITICNKLALWLDDITRQWCFIWLYGSAGCGKSAVAQTFAEKCDKLGRLGASFFFSRPNKRNDPKTVIPTIAYQLATHCSDYKAVITSQLADDPQLLFKSIPVQFKKLIIEPFTYLHNHRYESVKQPFLILLDGLDECEGETAQCEFVKLINEVVRVKKDLPLLWLVCSRPEAHLQHTFTRIIDCGREELVIDEECRDDVDRYLRDGLFELREKYHLDGTWPSQEKFDAVSKGGSGHFVFAATALGFIGDEDSANPVKRLNELVEFLNKAERDGITNPLAKLDFLYTSILSDIPEYVFPTTWRILAHFIYTRKIDRGDTDFLFESAQALCNFINVDQNTFYSALRKLYSVIAVPTPLEAATNPLRFYHASFQDFLVDRGRSGRFVIEEKRALVDITKSLFFWQEIDSAHFHTTDGWQEPREHNHGSLPGLKWTSGIDAQRLSKQIAKLSEWCWSSSDRSGFDEVLLPCVLQLDQRYLYLDAEWATFVNTYKEYFPRDFYRTQPCGEFDAQLLDYMKMMTDPESVEPASFPLTWDTGAIERRREYLLVGHGAMSVVVWFTEMVMDGWRIDRLNCDQAPSSDQIVEYQEWLEERRWCDEDSEDEASATPSAGVSDASESFKDCFENKGIPRPSIPHPPLPETPRPTPLSHTVQPPHSLPANQHAERHQTAFNSLLQGKAVTADDGATPRFVDADADEAFEDSFNVEDHFNFEDSFEMDSSEDGLAQYADRLPQDTSPQGYPSLILRPSPPHPSIHCLSSPKLPLPETLCQPVPSLPHQIQPTNPSTSQRGAKRKADPPSTERAKRQRRPPAELGLLTKGQPSWE